MGFTRAELDSFRDRTVPDLLPDPLRLLLVGINPGLISAATGVHFARRGNRFYPALHLAGITETVIDAGDGMSAADRAQLTDKGVGISNLCPRATARADELDDAELRAGVAHLTEIVTERAPEVVAILGITAFRTAFSRPKATLGWQDSPWEGTALYVAPNPSGLNAHAQVPDHAAAYAEIARAAGVI
ncbi:mismatch-specific DNA-glycosylase [Corynebacterium halotolerans]|uniref:mismatch-specific DNA-glycosylase n=1 Tax=Corynebacterium halotolerans TaxID=225326 RepID=UPI003CF3C8D6